MLDANRPQPSETPRHRLDPGRRPERVTVVVPTRNSDPTLEACLRGVRAQTHPDVELIVVDNHSTDATFDIAERYADLVVVGVPERSAQRNHGAALATGAFLCFLDSDLIVEPAVIADAITVFSADAAYGALVIPELAYGRGFWASCRALEKRLYVGDPDVEAARIFRRHAFDEVGGYDETLTGAEDWDLPERVETAGYRVGRVTSFAHHDEGALRLGEAFRKKRYYGLHSAGYLSKGGSRARRHFLRTALISHPGRLLAQPHLAAGLALLKAVEGAGFLSGVLARPPRRLSSQKLKA